MIYVRQWLPLAALLAFAPRIAEAGPPGAPVSWVIETVVGNGTAGDLPDGINPPLYAGVGLPFGVEIGPDGALYVTSIGQHRVLRVDFKKQALTSVAGSGLKGYAGDGGPADRALLNEPYEVRFDAEGNMYFVEMQNHLIRRVEAGSGIVSTLAGSPESGFYGDHGVAARAQFKQPHSIALDDRGFLYVADIGNHRIRRIDLKSRQILSIAGNGQLELPRDGGPALDTPILGPRALAIVGRTLWIALREGNSVWRLDLDSGLIHHVAGTGEAGYSGDGGPALAATFNGPKGIVATANGLVFVVDSENQAIRAIDAKSGQIHSVGGSGPRGRGFAGDNGPALVAKFNRPHGICLAPGGGIYVGDTNNNRVRWLHP